MRIATSEDYIYASEIADTMAQSASKRGTGIARRTPDYVINKIINNLAVIALNGDSGEWVGFSCLEVWQHEKYIAGTGLIVAPKYRGTGISRVIKLKLFEHYKVKYPASKLFSITTSPVVIEINQELGYKYLLKNDVITDPLFNEGNNSWVNYIELLEHNPLYVAMVYEPECAVIAGAKETATKSNKLLQIA